MKASQVVKMMVAQGPFNTMAFLKDWNTTLRMYFLYAGIETGLFQALREPCSKEALTKKLHPKRHDLFDALLEMGTATNELSIKRGKYHLRGRRARALAHDSDEMFTGLVQAGVTYYNVAFVDAGRRIAGGPLAELLDKYAEVIARFSRNTEPFIYAFLEDEMQSQSTVRLLELGCGSGIHLRSAYAINPNVTGIGVEMDARIATEARENLAKWQLSNNFDVIGGDIFEVLASGDEVFDVVTLFNNVYYFEEALRPKLFSQIKRKLSADGMFLMVTMMSSKGKDVMSAALNIATISETATTALPEEERLMEQLRDAGFESIERKRIMPKSAFVGFIAK